MKEEYGRANLSYQDIKERLEDYIDSSEKELPHGDVAKLMSGLETAEFNSLNSLQDMKEYAMANEIPHYPDNTLVDLLDALIDIKQENGIRDYEWKYKEDGRTRLYARAYPVTEKSDIVIWTLENVPTMVVSYSYGQVTPRDGDLLKSITDNMTFSKRSFVRVE